MLQQQPSAIPEAAGSPKIQPAILHQGQFRPARGRGGPIYAQQRPTYMSQLTPAQQAQLNQHQQAALFYQLQQQQMQGQVQAQLPNMVTPEQHQQMMRMLMIHQQNQQQQRPPS